MAPEEVAPAKPAGQTMRLVPSGPHDHLTLATIPPLESVTSIVDGQTECVFIYSPMVQAILDTPGFPKSVPSPLSPKPYAVKELPSKGLSMIATRDIKFGELIAAERALVISYRAIPPGFTDKAVEAVAKQAILDALERHLNMAIERMESLPWRKPCVDVYKNLCNSNLHDGSGPLGGIFQTNSYLIDIPFNESTTYSAVFNDLSRLNHSCSPNGFYNWDTASFSMQLYAVRDIKKNEEITTYYVHPMKPLAERRSHLALYGFACTCRACTSDVSQRDRQIMSYVASRLIPTTDWAEEPHKAPLSQLIQLLGHIEREGVEMTDLYGNTLYRLVLVKFVLGDVKEAKKYLLRWKVWLGFHTSDEKVQNTMQACLDLARFSRAAPPHPLFAPASLD